LRSITKWFLAGEALDVITTTYALNSDLGLKEGNPIFNTPISMMIAKVVVTALGVFILERFYEQSKLLWIIPAVVWIPFFWNTSMIILAHIMLR
jgi:hypothetical protein